MPNNDGKYVNNTYQSRMTNHNTSCCSAKAEKKGRLEYRCAACGNDVTIEMFLVWEHTQKKRKNEQKTR